jgi:hypothetical protein
MIINKDLGYYVCNGKEFRSKINALLYSKLTHKPVEWNFNDERYNEYPWEIEPEHSMDYYYDKRARELREKYDYIIISYSGGADSHNVLESFIRQNLHVDEILTNHVSLGAKSIVVADTSVKNSWNFAAEYDLQMLPRLKEIQSRIPKTKITVIDVSETVISGLTDDPDWVLDKNDHMSPGNLFRYNYFYFKDIKKNFDRNLNIGMILGVDKPKVQIDSNGDCYVSFNDRITNIVTVNEHNTDYTNMGIEMFYWSPETAPMICKQIHVIKRWLEKYSERQKYWDGSNFALGRLYQERFLRPLLYSSWNDSWFQVDKSTSWWYCEFDTWFRTNPEFANQYQAWKRGIDFLTEKLPEYVNFDSNTNLPDSFKVFSKRYKFGNISKSLM